MKKQTTKQKWGEVAWVVVLTLVILQAAIWVSNKWVAAKTADMRAEIGELQKQVKILNDQTNSLRDDWREIWNQLDEIQGPKVDVNMEVSPAPATQGSKGPV